MIDEKDDKKNHISIAEQNSLTYQKAMSNILEARWQCRGGVALDETKFKVYHWIDAKKNLKRYLAFVKLPEQNKPIKKIFSTDAGEAKAWRFIFDVVDRYNSGATIESIMNPELTFNQWVATFNSKYNKKNPDKISNTAEREGRIKRLSEYFGDMKLNVITSMTIANYFNMRKDSVCVKSVSNEIFILKKILKYAVFEKYIPVNPFDEFYATLYPDLSKEESAAVLSKTKKEKRRPIQNIEEIFRAVWEIKELRNFCFFFYYTGMRNSDIIWLKRENIQETNGIHYFDLREGKTKKDLIVPVHQALFDNEVISMSGEYLFEYSCSRKNAVKRLGELFKKQLAKNNLNINITPYWLRHTFNETLERLEVNFEIRERLMGKKKKSSMKHYTHNDLVTMKDAIDKLPTHTFFSLFSHQAKTAGSESMLKTAVYV